jgi:hypothetical protein
MEKQIIPSCLFRLLNHTDRGNHNQTAIHILTTDLQPKNRTSTTSSTSNNSIFKIGQRIIVTQEACIADRGFNQPIHDRSIMLLHSNTQDYPRCHDLVSGTPHARRPQHDDSPDIAKQQARTGWSGWCPCHNGSDRPSL